MRVSTGSGSRRVTITSGLALVIGRFPRSSGEPAAAPCTLLTKGPANATKGAAAAPRLRSARRAAMVRTHDSARASISPLGARRCCARGSAGRAAPAERGAGRRTEPRGTGLPLPRFVSLKSDNVNVRRGPGPGIRRGLHLRARRPAGGDHRRNSTTGGRSAIRRASEGWVFHSLLSGERTALVAPWEKTGQFAAHSSADAEAAVVAYLQPRVIADVEECTGDLVPWSAARVTRAGSSRSGCGASIRTRNSRSDARAALRRARQRTRRPAPPLPPRDLHAGGRLGQAVDVDARRRMSISLPSPSTKK